MYDLRWNEMRLERASFLEMGMKSKCAFGVVWCHAVLSLSSLLFFSSSQEREREMKCM
jgi:hypothetical protein